MFCTRKVSDNIHWVGGSDRRLALFENIFPISRGVSYNSYVITDEKTAVIVTADSSISEQFIENVMHVLNGRELDYIVINHMEPDHCANIMNLVLRFPNAKLVGNAKTFVFLNQFYSCELEGKTITVKEGDALGLGEHTLRFYMTPMVHWPEVMVAYEEKENILFSADAFGSFGALNGNIFNDEINFDRDWIDDARRYYCNIVGKYGLQVKAAIGKLSALNIKMICPLHGPIWRNNIEYLLDKYQHWSEYRPEDKSVVIIYASMYGNTENAANVLAAKLADEGVKNIAVYDVSNTHVSTLIAEIFRSSHIVLAAPTYNGAIYPIMYNLLHDMQQLNVQNRTIGIIDNGTWAVTAGKQMRDMLAQMKNMNVLEPTVSVKSSLKEETMIQLEGLKQAIIDSL